MDRPPVVIDLMKLLLTILLAILLVVLNVFENTVLLAVRSYSIIELYNESMSLKRRH